jgi:putative transposase
MVNYRRNKIIGATYFFTVTLRNRKSKVLVEHINELRQAFQKVQQAKPYRTIAAVILPDHLHVIWQLPPDDADYSGRWRHIKSLFTRSLIKSGKNYSRDKSGEYSLWQRRFWEHTIKDDDDLEQHVNYIHYNPVKHGFVNRVCDWSYSSFHRYVREGVLTADWAGEKVLDTKNNYGE